MMVRVTLSNQDSIWIPVSIYERVCDMAYSKQMTVIEMIERIMEEVL